MTLNHDDFKSEWLRVADIKKPVEFTVIKDYVIEKEINDAGRKYDKFIFTVKNEAGEQKKFSRWKSGVNRMVRAVEKFKDLKSNTLSTLEGTKWLNTCQADSNEGKVYETKFIPKTAPSKALNVGMA